MESDKKNVFSKLSQEEEAEKYELFEKGTIEYNQQLWRIIQEEGFCYAVEKGWIALWDLVECEKGWELYKKIRTRQKLKLIPPLTLKTPWSFSLKIDHSKKEWKRNYWIQDKGSSALGYEAHVAWFNNLQYEYPIFVKHGGSAIYRSWDNYDEEQIIVLYDYDEPYLSGQELKSLA
jgi:hypothetical protein